VLLWRKDSVKENAVAQVASDQPESVQSTKQPEAMQDDSMAEDTNYHVRAPLTAAQ
jgi:hypothetical protein